MATALTATILLLFITNIFWAVQVHRLMNKLMSRNYGEYLSSDLPRSNNKEQNKREAIDTVIPDEQMGSVAEIY